MLEVKGVTVCYGLAVAVNNVSLTIEQGKVLALVGRNGAGKTSLLRGIVAVQRVSSGEVTFDGKRLSGMTTDKIANSGVVMVPEERRIFASLTVEENLRVGLSNLPRKDRRSSLDPILQIFPALRDRLGEQAGQLSGGQQQMLAIGRALVARPKLLMLDEPSLGLAPNIVERVIESVKVLAKEGLTILIVEQNAQWVADIADSVAVMRRGEIVLQAPMEGIKNGDVTLADSF